jgi:CubicO group peptidase (beta-lactamase class C family)
MLRMRRVAALATTLVLTLVPLAACSEDHDPKPAEPDDQAALISAVNEQLEVDPDHDNLRALVVQVHGKPVLGQYYDWPVDTYWDIESTTSSILSALVGIAIEEGDISGTDETLVELLPDHAADMRPEVADTTLRELLTMTAGFAGLDRDRTPEYMADPDAVGRILRAAPDPLGGGFEFSNQDIQVLSAVLAEATGMSVLDYARSRLFEPLGIDTRPAFEGMLDARSMDEYVAADFAWPVDGSGLNLGWTGLKLRPADLARFGQMMLQEGKWKGEQLVPADWVRESTTEQIDTVSRRNQPNASGKYGYQWWVTEADGEPAYFSWGRGGQLLEVVPSRSLVVVVASEVDYSKPRSAGFSANVLTFLVDDVIAPAVAP